jgi:hypothetical protein
MLVQIDAKTQALHLKLFVSRQDFGYANSSASHLLKNGMHHKGEGHFYTRWWNYLHGTRTLIGLARHPEV